MVVGLTGGIACGKTTIAKIFQSLGAEVIDADSLGHQLLKSDPLVYEKLVARFGKGILSKKGEIDRSKLGRIVFDNSEHLKALNEIIHPPLIELTKAKIKELASDKIIVIDAPLLIECNLTGMVDSVVLVYADEEVQIQRLIQRGLSLDDARKRIRSQMPFHKKEQLADFVIYNNGLLSDTVKQVKQVWNALTK